MVVVVMVSEERRFIVCQSLEGQAFLRVVLTCDGRADGSRQEGSWQENQGQGVSGRRVCGRAEVQKGQWQEG